MFKFNNEDTRTTPRHIVITPCSSVSIINFGHVIAGWIKKSDCSETSFFSTSHYPIPISSSPSKVGKKMRCVS